MGTPDYPPSIKVYHLMPARLGLIADAGLVVPASPSLGTRRVDYVITTTSDNKPLSYHATELNALLFRKWHYSRIYPNTEFLITRVVRTKYIDPKLI